MTIRIVLLFRIRDRPIGSDMRRKYIVTAFTASPKSIRFKKAMLNWLDGLPITLFNAKYILYGHIGK